MRSLDITRVDRSLPFTKNNINIHVSGLNIAFVSNLTIEVDESRDDIYAYIDVQMFDKDPQAAIDNNQISIMDMDGKLLKFDFIDDEVYGYEKMPNGTIVAKMSFPVNMTLRTKSN